MNCSLRKADGNDYQAILGIIGEGRAYLQAQGLPQWQGGYGPQPQDIERDITRGEGYVLLSGSEICGYAALCGGVDEYYGGLYGGAWNNSNPEYITIHRVAVGKNFRGRGLSHTLLDESVAVCKSLGVYDIRVDTHSGNAIMQKAIEHAGFAYRGMINLPIPHGERKAFQLTINPEENR
jgi:GNAT superfamily N-acetyltransferase